MVPLRCNKQLRVAQSIYDNDAVLLKPIGEGSRFLSRSASVLERHVGAALSTTRSVKLDEHVRLLLTADGPTFVAKAQRVPSCAAREGSHTKRVLLRAPIALLALSKSKREAHSSGAGTP